MTQKDLSAFSRDPIEGRLKEKTLQQFCLTEDQIKHFHQFGYVSGIRVVEDSALKALRSQLAELFDPNHPSGLCFTRWGLGG